MKEFFRSKGSALFILVILLVGLVSFRYLSDPDIGTHLRAGKWIVENHRVPDNDTFSYTCTNHAYLDSHWLFQVLAYMAYRLTGYNGLSILVFLLSLLLFYLLFRRAYKPGNSPFILSWALLLGFLCIETRITLRLEMFTFLFMTLLLQVLDNYYHEKKEKLFLLPVIMLFWSNMHGLFILGYLLSGSYFISLYIRDRKPDLYFLKWAGFSFLASLVNPYTYRLLAFPFLLNTRLNADNIFHQHIREFTSFHRLEHFLFKDYIFIAFFLLTFLLLILTWKKRKVHELILTAVFFYLAWASIRNIALFAVIAIPILSTSAMDLYAEMRPRMDGMFGAGKVKRISTLAFVLSGIFVAGISLRVFTNSYYTDNSSYNRTGTGVDDRHLPVKAAAFINDGRLDGRIINALSLGGWLSWSIPQPVFIDGRLEVMGEAIYSEVSASWSGGLGTLIRKYEPSMIIYNYDKYYPWTVQLSGMEGWRLIYVDGFTAIFARSDYASGIPAFDLSVLPRQYAVGSRSGEEIRAILGMQPPTVFTGWLKGFYEKPDYELSDLSNLASFCLQMKDERTAALLFVEILRRTKGGASPVYYALADIYRASGDLEKAAICYRRILETDPANQVVKAGLQAAENGQAPATAPPVPEKAASPDKNENEAVNLYNEANVKYRQGDFNGAGECYRQAISLKPDYFKAYNNLGILKASELKDFSGALKDFDKAIGINPGYADAYLGRGTCLLNLHETEKACRDWAKALSLGNRQAENMIRNYCK